MDADHSMDLREFARLAGLRELPKGSPQVIVITPALAEALDNLLEVCDDVSHGRSHDMDIGPAIDRVHRLHDWRAVRLGGEPVAPAPTEGMGS